MNYSPTQWLTWGREDPPPTTQAIREALERLRQPRVRDWPIIPLDEALLEATRA